MLSVEEKAAGRVFREAMQKRLTASAVADPPTYVVPNFIANFRHVCTAIGGRSAAMELREMYVLSPARGPVPEGRFAFLWREGRCPRCGDTARSTTGRIVLARDRPPLSSRRPISRNVRRTDHGGTTMPEYDYPYEKPTPGAEEAERPADVPNDVPTPEQPAPEQTIAGSVYDNPNEDLEYVPPEVEPATEKTVLSEGDDDE